MITARSRAKASAHAFIESVAINAPGIKSNGGLDVPSSPYTS